MRAVKLPPWLVVLVTVSAGSLACHGQSQDPTRPPAGRTESIPEETERVHLGPGMTRGLLIDRANPEYPNKARRNRNQGTVVLNAMISKEGDIVDLSPVSGDPLLVKAAVKAVQQWNYKPYLFQGKAVEVDTEIRVNFTLSGN